ncbi:hypothetical protein BAQU_0742 [Bifidobacterium aquikefiri]|uniref:Uncharacterized protein n=1 Tax=Bifidobacterium aquikefiri TaxID=1653207 RepID=A0A261G8A4_9BIFI|nr:hypothetical protein BAQU_0742 [Bifidobacterium aquikefiri]
MPLPTIGKDLMEKYGIFKTGRWGAQLESALLLVVCTRWRVCILIWSGVTAE